MLAWDLDISNPPVTKLHWLRLIIRKPKLIRHYSRWRKSLETGVNGLNESIPRFVYEATDWLEAYLKPGMRVFEWGSGGSTLFFAHRTGKVITVEHDPAWYAAVAEALRQQGIRNVTLLLCEPDRARPGEAMYASIDERYSGLQFLHYAEVIEAYPDNSFDLVSVDGRARPACAAHALGKVRPGGFLLLDDSDRDRYKAGRQLLAHWKERHFVGPKPYSALCSATTVWQKPSHALYQRSSGPSISLETVPIIRPQRHAFEMEVTPGCLELYVRPTGKPLTTSFLTNLLTSARLFVDVGARSGFYSLLAATGNPPLEVLALEPDKNDFEVLTRNIERNNLRNIRAIRTAPWKDHGDMGTETMAIDALLKDHAPCPTILMISAGGHELEVLDGMLKTLCRFPELSLLMELNPNMPERVRHSPEQILEKLNGLGFDTYVLDDRQGFGAKITNSRDWRRLVDPEGYTHLYCPRRERSLSVCFFSHSGKLGGAERSLLELVTELIQDHGCVCTVVLPEKGPLSNALTQSGAACVYVPYSWWCDFVPVSAAEASYRISDSLASLSGESLQILTNMNPDIIVTFTMVIPWGAVAAGMLGKPHVWHICEYGERDHGFNFFFPFHEVLGIIRRSSAALFTCSKTLHRVLFPDMSEEECVTLYRHITLPPEPCGNAQQAYYSRPGAVRLAVFGAICEGKGQEYAVRAVAELIRIGHHVELLLAGSSFQDYDEKLKRLIRECSVEPHVRLSGYLQDVYTAMRQTDIVLVCSRSEAFGRVAVEAMLLAKPVVYPRSGAFPEYMIDGETGVAYTSGDWLQLADRIRPLLESPEMRLTLGTKGQAYAQEMFSSQEYGGKAFKFLQELKGGPPSPIAGRLFTLILKAMLDKSDILKTMLEESNKIKRTVGWTILLAYWRTVDIALPPGTRRRRTYDSIFEHLKASKTGVNRK